MAAYELDAFTVLMNPEKKITDPVIKKCLERDKEIFPSFKIYTPGDPIVQEALEYFREYLAFIDEVFPDTDLTRYRSDMVRLYILWKSTWRTLYIDWDIYVRNPEELYRYCRMRRSWSAGYNWYLLWSNGDEETYRNLTNYFRKRLPELTKKVLEQKDAFGHTAIDDYRFMADHHLQAEINLKTVDLGKIGEHYTKFKWSPASLGLFSDKYILIHTVNKDPDEAVIEGTVEQGEKEGYRPLYIVPETGVDMTYVMSWKDVFESEEDCIEYLKKNSRNEVRYYG